MNIEAAKRRRVKEKGRSLLEKKDETSYDGTSLLPFYPFYELIGLYLHYTYKRID